MSDEPSLIDFPCNFPVKIFTKNEASLIRQILKLTRKHFPAIKDEALKKNLSQSGNYQAITITVYALDKATLDAYYHELSLHPDVKMVL